MRRHAGGATILCIRLFVLTVVLAAIGASILPADAAAHAVLIDSSPAAEARLPESPASVRLRFNEPIQLVQAADLDVVDGDGTPASIGVGAVPPDDATALAIALRPGLPPGTYTARFRVLGADSHVITGVMRFGIGPGALSEPVLAGTSAGSGPGATGFFAVSARFAELVMLGGLVGLLAFRWLVWRPALLDVASESHADHVHALAWGRDVFWVGFGVLALGAMLAEGYLLVVQSASVLGTSVMSAVGDIDGIGEVLADTRFGTLIQTRAILLFLLFAVGSWQFLAEYGGRNGGSREPTAAGKPLPALLMAALLGTILWQVSAQGHASQAPLPLLQTGLHFAHMVAVAVWIGGLALVGLTLWQLPRAVPNGGRELGTAVLAHLSRVALLAVGVAVATGIARASGQLSDPADLWETAYGRSIVIKIALLSPIAFLALRNRRLVTSLRVLGRPNAAALVMVRRGAGAELAISLAIVVVASLLTAQVPGRL